MLEGFSGGIIVALVDFFMVFIVLGGLAAAIVGLRKIVGYWERSSTVAVPQPKAVPSQEPGPPPESEKDRTTAAHIAAILAAIQEFTGLPIGSFKIDTIEPTEAVAREGINPAHIAAISAAIYEYGSLPAGSFRIAGIKHLGSTSSWKMAGRMELMGIED